MRWSLALAAYSSVFAAEIVGDKTLFTLGVLVPRHRVPPLFIGALVAVALKMLAAVWFGSIVGGLPARVVSVVSALTFLGLAIRLWVKEPVGAPPSEPLAVSSSWASMCTAFCALFLSEWGDVGQLAAATVSATSRDPIVVWLGATAAMATKVLIGLVFGIGMRRWAPQRVVRPLSASVCIVMAAVSLAG